MNKIIVVLFLVCAFFSCKEKEVEVTPEIILSKDEFTISEQGGVLTFHVKSNVKYSIKSSTSWINVSSVMGEIGTKPIELNIEANALSQDREGDVVISSGTWEKKIKVYQDGAKFLNINKTELHFSSNEETKKIALEYSGNLEVEIKEDWVQTSLKDGLLAVSVLENINIFNKEAILKLKIGATEKQIAIYQKGKDIYTNPEKIGVEKDAATLAKEIRLGWNLGNALEASSSEFVASETLWGNPKTSKELIDLVKKSGFNAIRIPISWSGYIVDRSTHQVSDEWLNRVKEVVDYCISNQMYVIINMHWDGGWLENNPVYAKQKEILEKQNALWSQISVFFRNYDEHLLFAGTNEVHFDYGTPTKEHLEVQMSFNQNFVNTVRATGGKNTYRNLIIQSYNTNITWAVEHLVLPKDKIENRLMVEVHFYDPYDFTIDTGNSYKMFWGKDFKSNVSDWGQEDWVKEAFRKMKEKYVSKQIPVVLGEYGAMLRHELKGEDFENHKKSRNYYLSFVTKTAIENGLLPFYWDNGVISDKAMGIFNRKNISVHDSEALNALRF